MFGARQSYPSIYVPSQTVMFSTPLWVPGSAVFWEDFIREVETVDELCLDYTYEDASKHHVDTPISDRMYVKDLMLLELPITDPRYHDRPYNPGNSDDEFYDGVRCAFAMFGGQHQLLGLATQEMKDGWLPGLTRKPMDLIEIRVVKTKHVMVLDTHATWKAYHRGKDDIHIEKREELVNHPERAILWLPTCCEKSLIVKREVTGDWKELPRFVPSYMSIDQITEEPEEDLDSDILSSEVKVEEIIERQTESKE